MLDLLRCAFPDRSHHHAAVPADFVVIAPLVVGARPDAAIFRRQQEWRLAYRKLRIAACFLAPLLASALPLSVTTRTQQNRLLRFGHRSFRTQHS
jgi:hypothetical protein